GEKSGASGLIETPDAAPEIDFPKGIQHGRGRASGRATVREGRAEGIVASPADDPAIVHIWNELRPCLHGEGTGLLDARDGYKQIIIVRERLADQRLQGGVAIDLPPIQLGK